MSANIPLYGLVLSGGQSTRMGQDKGLLSYHGQPQRDYLYHMLNSVCPQVFLSVRPGQEQEVSNEVNVLADALEVRGPLNGILSAMQQHPQAAWLVIACDMPLVRVSTLQKLVVARDLTKTATAYAVQGSDLPEPLLAIWEPGAYASALAFTQTGKTCPRKFLLNADTKLIYPDQDEELYNANHPEERAYILQKLHHGPAAVQ
ncbi:NTP transferase domain-containing protein [Nibribacter koreensis]|uniref:Probable molybdenum cofactor guanylyltransferase n=1 Tax=Nibribacter koreensis TaxID=1084519 RepID=A0ABP8F5P1_9BACT